MEARHHRNELAFDFVLTNFIKAVNVCHKLIDDFDTHGRAAKSQRTIGADVCNCLQCLALNSKFVAKFVAAFLKL